MNHIESHWVTLNHHHHQDIQVIESSSLSHHRQVIGIVAMLTGISRVYR